MELQVDTNTSEEHAYFHHQVVTTQETDVDCCNNGIMVKEQSHSRVNFHLSTVSFHLFYRLQEVKTGQ